ncbi:threonine--tRNA ligase [Candidatus Dependentiae bacterium]|nr:threonine--tRNA ligase [Candidatus Dependentiae bacterium]
MSSNKNLSVLRHSAAHLLAQAVTELYPETLLTIGPATAEGFFYDFLPTRNFKEEDLPLLEARMHELSKRNLTITHKEISKDEARKIFKNNKFKLQLIDEIPAQTVGLSQQGDFYDLCRGGHVASTGDIKHFKLLNISGAYWKADKNNQALQRITGTAFYTQEELDAFLRKKEELAQFDHRKLGKQMNLFSFHDEGVGFPFFHPDGKLIINLLIDYLRDLQTKHGYKEIATPIMLSDELWKRSGHYAHYKDNMYFCTIDDKEYAIRPMNCPGSYLVYKERPHSYRELPLKLAEFGLVHRHELSGVLHGLMRVRAFTQDDTHAYCTIEQLEEQLLEMINLTKTVYNRFNFKNIKVALSTRPKDAMGSPEVWDKAINALKNALNKAQMKFVIQEGEGAFYGPKIEFKIQDSMEREWQCGTIQVDFFAAENFDLSYVTPAGTKERPVVIHRAIYGSLERFFAILLEHFKGHLPFWLAPVQVKILTITDDQKEYAQKLLQFLNNAGIRSELDHTSDPISGKIKTAQIEKIPWMLVIGKKEVEMQTVTLRHANGTQEPNLQFDELVAKTKELAAS